MMMILSMNTLVLGKSVFVFYNTISKRSNYIKWKIMLCAIKLFKMSHLICNV